MHRKASPPRPTLLVGDLSACYRAYDDLKARVESALSASPQATRSTWQDMVPRFRALRESIVHLDEQGRFSLHAYELAAEACWRARDWGEFLKCIQQLLYTIYPRFYPDAFADNQAIEGASDAAVDSAVVDQGGPRDGEHGSADSLSGGALPLREEALGRLPEIAAAHILYFACVVAKPETFEMVAVLRGLPPRVLRLPSVQAALQAAALNIAGDNAGFLRLHRCAQGLSPMAQALMEERAGAARRDLMCMAAASFRVLPLAPAARMLQIHDDGGGAAEAEAAVIGVLKEAAEKGGSRGASHALEKLQGGGFDGPSAGGGAVTALHFK